MTRTAATGLALAGLMAVGMAAQQADGVRHFPAADVDEGFRKGGTLTQVDNVTLMTASRAGAGESEVHDADTDIFHVLEGTAEFVTGGTIVGGRTTAPGETRGTGIEGGRSIRLEAGDVITIPRGTPHWFKDVTPPFRYFVVKVRK